MGLNNFTKLKKLMPTYPVIHKETREKKELSMTMKEYDQWRKDNPEWDKDWQAGVAEVFRCLNCLKTGAWEVREDTDQETEKILMKTSQKELKEN